MTDICIVGAGPAGISAAIYALRGGFSVTVVDSGTGALRKADKVENYYGFPEAISGKQLAVNGIAQANRLGAAFLDDEAVALAPHAEGFSTITAEGDEIVSRAVVLATGSPRKIPQIAGLAALEGHGVSYCAVCDAFFYRSKDVVVLGFGEYAKAEALHLLPLVNSVTLLTNGKPQGADFPFEVKIIHEPLAQIAGEKRVEGVILADGRTIPADGVFVAYGAAGGSDLARKIGAIVEGTRIITDEKGATNIPGLYAAGDCTGGTLQIAKAVYDGMNVGLSLVVFLRMNTQNQQAIGT
ncbi:MAG: FAD-dependent oxidoreductase [Oscillospiraceae bacterium]|nr:FAD-dependent oxidoreductase [Oscillospiraceae bacterium]